MRTFDKILINGRSTQALDGPDFAVLNLRCELPMKSDYRFYLNDEEVEWHQISRPDLGKKISWFSVYLDLTKLPLGGENSLNLTLGGEVLVSAILYAGTTTRSRLAGVREEIRRKRALIPALLTQGELRGEKVLNIDPAIHDPALRLKSDKVSTHPYSSDTLATLAAMPEGALALDVGAGFRSRHHPRVVTLEIFDYPSTDVISFGNSIPFADASFSHVYCNAVLEHVDNPFSVAREIARVLKPGGTLYSAVPFMHYEHGYPYHYFNATRMGHKRLYEDNFDIESIKVGPQGHPWHVIISSLGHMRSGIAGPLRKEFDQLTVGDILGKSYQEWVGSPYGQVKDDTMWQLAATTVLKATKKNTKGA